MFPCMEVVSTLSQLNSAALTAHLGLVHNVAIRSALEQIREKGEACCNVTLRHADPATL